MSIFRHDYSVDATDIVEWTERNLALSLPRLVQQAMVATCGSGGSGMKKAQATFEALFGYKRAALALACLADGPLRWTDVRDAIIERTGAGIGDKDATRALHALQKMGLVDKVDSDDGNHLWALTPQGANQAQWAADILDRLDHHEQPGTESPRDGSDEQPTAAEPA